MNILSLEFLDKIISILKTQNKKLTAHEITVLFITDDFYFLYKKDFQINNYLPILVKDALTFGLRLMFVDITEP